MTAATLNQAAAREELGKFLQLATDLGPGLKMFSGFIDHEWHTLLQDPEAYKAFCTEKARMLWRHTSNGSPTPVVVEWVSDVVCGNMAEFWACWRAGDWSLRIGSRRDCDHGISCRS